MVLTTPQQREVMLAKIRELMVARGMWAYIVPDNDPHMSEYLPDQYKRREAITGFSGSAGTAIITSDGPCLLWTDSRYFLQAATQLSGSAWTLMREREPDVPTILEWIAKEIERRSSQSPDGVLAAKVGVDPAVFPASQYKSLCDVVHGSGGVLLDPENLVDLVWDDVHTLCGTRTPTHVLPLSVCGESVSEKVARVLQTGRKEGTSGLIVCELNEVAWLLNLRGRDVPCVPVVYSFAVVYVTPAGATELEVFVDPEVVPEGVRADLIAQAKGVHVAFFPYEAAYTRIREVAEKVKLCIPVNSANMRLVQSLGGCAVPSESCIWDLMSVKNSVEQAGFAYAHLKNAVAAAKLFAWLETARDVTEFDVSEKLEELSRSDPDYMEASFDTIAGFGSNGAVVHYEPQKESAAKMDKSDILLLDFGGHYACGGTTDTTRTVFYRVNPNDTPSDEQRRSFTTVLRGHIAIAMATFKDKTVGSEIDSLCRNLMAEHGLKYGHGTGHGINTLLAVHGAPDFKFSKLTRNQIITIEPGVYFEGKFGIRIENVAVIKSGGDGGEGDKLHFDVITRTPFDLSLIDATLMTQAEKDWVNAFSRSCREDLTPFLKDDPVAMAWLLKNTNEI